MASWTFTINDKKFNSAEISVGLWSAVAQVLGDKVKTFDDLQPFLRPDALAVWYAVLMADSTENKNVNEHLRVAYEMPLAQLVSMVNVE